MRIPKKTVRQNDGSQKMVISKVVEGLPAFKGNMENIDPLFMSATIAAMLENTNPF